jgi:hypothetical protein
MHYPKAWKRYTYAMGKHAATIHKAVTRPKDGGSKQPLNPRIYAQSYTVPCIINIALLLAM